MRIRTFVTPAIVVSVLAGVAGACGDSTSETPTTPDAAGVETGGGGVDSGFDTSSPIDSSTKSDAPIDTGVDAKLDTGVDAGPRGCATDGTDSFYSQVVAYVPCTVDLTETTGRSTLTMFNTPTVSALPAGAPGGASCALGHAGTISTANGFTLLLPSAIGTADFTAEVSVYQTAYSDPSDQQSEILIGDSAYPPTASGFPSFYSHQVVQKVQFISGSGGPAAYTDDGSTLNAWHSYAASRIAGTTYVFRDGTLLTSFADTSDYTDTLVHVGHQANGPFNAVMGSVGQIRITKAGRYSTAYTKCAGGFATK